VDAPGWIEVDELQRLAVGLALVRVGVRQSEEFTAPLGHLSGAINVPVADLPNRDGELAARRQPIVAVCKTDRRQTDENTRALAAAGERRRLFPCAALE
jgi:3-mercaptopyruvate sulfurtransferase SseA